jgi:membrane dipeptidase
VPLGDVYTNPPRYGGLTAFGASVIKECNRHGMVVDLAHASMQTTQAALKTTNRPVIISHTGLDTQLGNDPRMAQMMRPRLISKEQAKIVAEAGGAIGVWTHLSDTPLEYAHNIRALVDVIASIMCASAQIPSLPNLVLALRALHLEITGAIPV